MAVILCDEHVPYPITKGLRARGVQVSTVRDEHLVGIPDDRILLFAYEKKMVILTNDHDFLRLAKSNSHSGVFYITSQYHDYGAIIQGVIRILDRHVREELENALFYIP